MADFHFVCQTVIFYLLVIAGLVSVIPIWIVSIKFGGNCILNAKYKVSENKVIWSPAGLCNFVTGFNGIASILCTIIMSVYYTYVMHKKEPGYERKMWVIPWTVVSAIITIMAFIGCAIVSANFSIFCNALVSHFHLSSCRDTQQLPKFIHDIATGKEYDHSNWADLYTVGSISFWVCCLLWLIQTGLYILRWYRNARNKTTEMFTDPSTADTRQITDASDANVI